MHKPFWMTEQQYIVALESFLAAVAIELKCLPSFADPTPEDGNAHIMRKLRELTANSPHHTLEADKEWRDDANDCSHCHSRNTVAEGPYPSSRCKECGRVFLAKTR